MPRRLVCIASMALLLLAAAPAGGDEDGRMFDPRFREGAPSDALLAGPPRLSRGHLHAFVDLLETAFDVALPAQVEQDLRDALEGEFEAGNTQSREAFLALVDSLAYLRARALCCDWQTVHAGLRRFRAAIDKRLGKDPKAAANAILLGLLRRRHEVVWRGDPALKALAVEAYLEMAVFVASLGRNEPIRLSPGQVGALRDYLGKDLRDCKYVTRDCLVGAHRVWLRVKARWDRSRDARRFGMRWAAVGLMARLAPCPGGLQIRRGEDHAAYAREASKVAAADKSFDAVTALARNPKALLDTVCCGLALGARAPPFPFLYR